MTVKSLRDSILEHLSMHKGGQKTASHNIELATKDFAKSKAPQFKGKSKEKRHQMAVAAGLAAARGESVENKAPALTEGKVAGLKKGTQVLYKGKKAKIESLNESSGLATIKLTRQREPIFAKIADLQVTALTEGVLGMTAIPFTYIEPREAILKLEALSADDIGLDLSDIRGLMEDDESGEKDDQEEDFDNGSNVRHDGHTGKTEIDNLPTPSDTIAPAYSDEKPPKQEGTPLSIEKGAEPGKLWQEPDWDGYDYPADAPVIPTAEFPGSDMGNARAPDQSDHHDAGDGQEDRHSDDDEDDDTEETDESYSPDNRFSFMMENWWKLGEASINEISDLLGPGEDTEPGKDAHITVTLPAMASICCTARHCDHETLKAMIEALAEVGDGKTLDVHDLDAVARHVNGEEEQEVVNRDESRPEHAGIGHDDHDDDSDDHAPPPPAHHDHDDHDADHEGSDDSDEPDGDGEPTKDGKEKLFGGDMEECPMEEGFDYYGYEDIVRESQMSEEDEIRLVKKRAGLKFW